MMTSSDEEQQCVIETYGFAAMDARSKQAYESVYGKKSLELAHILGCIERQTAKKDIPPHVLFQLIRSFFKAIKTQDPLDFHQDLARRILEKEHKTNNFDSALIDLLAREICDTFNAIGDKLFPVSWMSKTEDLLDSEAQKQGAGESVLNIIELNGPSADKESFNKGIFKPLKVYLTFLESMGEKGKEHAGKVREKGRGQ